MKILHLPTSVGGNAWGLSRGERKLGLSSDVLYQSRTWLDYPADIVLTKSAFYPAVFLASVAAAFRYPKNYDVLHFNFGSTLIDIPERGIHHWDLPLYKKQQLFVTYNGCDARQKYRRIKEMKITGCQSGCSTPLCTNEKRDRMKGRRVKQFEDAGARFFALNPDFMYDLPQSAVFLPYTIAGWDEIEPAPVLQTKGKIVLVHAPTNQLIKGSAAILRAVKALQQKYPGRIEFKLVQGVPHEEALRIYRSADVVIDQLLMGWYGGLGAEVMRMGKPVMAYIREEDLHFLPPQMAKDCTEAVISVTEDTLRDELARLIEAPALIARQSERALAYAHRWHDPVKVAEITKSAYEN